MEKTDPDYWLSIKTDIENGKKVIVRLSDEQTIEEAISRKGGVEGIDYSVVSCLLFKEKSGLTKTLFIQLDDAEDPEGEVILVVKIVDNDIDLKIHFKDDEFEPRTRADLIKDDELWLFEGNEDDPDDLVYIDAIQQEINEEDVLFEMKPQGVLTGVSTVAPKESGVDSELLTQVIEYSTGDEIDNPELLVTEIGSDTGGGVITVMPGAYVSSSEVDVLR